MASRDHDHTHNAATPKSAAAEGVTPDAADALGPLPMADARTYLEGFWGRNDLRVGPNMLAWALDSALQQVDGLVAALTIAADRFERYALLHSQKRTPDGDAKARSNALMAQQCRDAIAKAATPTNTPS
jgi:hypothetical protein